MHIVIFRLHGQLNLETQYIGPFKLYEYAYEYLCELPALGICNDGDNPGCKYIAEVTAPNPFFGAELLTDNAR